MTNLDRITTTDLYNLIDIEIQDIDTKEYPKFESACISSASYPDGTELTDEEIDYVNDNSGFVYDKVVDWVF